jgi:hypothetical protein
LTIVRMDESAKHNQLIKRFLVQRGPRDLVSPSVLTIPEKTTRWNVEEVLRKSKMFPTFHAGPGRL